MSRSLERVLAIEILDPIKRMRKELAHICENAGVLTKTEKYFVSVVEENLAYLSEIVEVRRASEGIKDQVFSITNNYKPTELPEDEDFKW